MVSLDVGEGFELPHHTLLCSATGKTQEITSKWKRTCTCACTRHVQSRERSAKQNKQLIPPPHNTPSVRSMTMPAPAAIHSGFLNCQYVCINKFVSHLISFPLKFNVGFYGAPDPRQRQISFLPSLENSKMLRLCSWCVLKWVTLFIWLKRTCVCCLSCNLSLCSCLQCSCVRMGVALGRNSKGRQEPCMHHKSLLSLVSSISSKQGPYGSQVPHLCLCATRSRVESRSQMVNGKKVNPTAGIFNSPVLTRTSGCFLSLPFSSPFPLYLASSCCG